MSKITAQMLADLRQFDTPTICNVIELFDVRPRTDGYLYGQIQACFPDMAPVVGFASTATCRTGVRPRSSEGYSLLTDHLEHFAELSGPAFVVFQELDQPVRAATFGEVMCTGYQAFGAVGLVTNGAARDLDQVEALDFPVFTNGMICSHGYIHLLDIHEPVFIDNQTIYPDDLIHADRNGVTTVPKDIVPELADVAGEFVSAEKIMLDAMRQPDTQLSTVKDGVAQAHDLIADLRKRVQRR
jgi:regulator of RNase E activity RraA